LSRIKLSSPGTDPLQISWIIQSFVRESRHLDSEPFEKHCRIETIGVVRASTYSSACCLFSLRCDFARSLEGATITYCGHVTGYGNIDRMDTPLSKFNIDHKS
jgi:hypothetical protein